MVALGCRNYGTSTAPNVCAMLCNTYHPSPCRVNNSISNYLPQPLLTEKGLQPYIAAQPENEASRDVGIGGDFQFMEGWRLAGSQRRVWGAASQRRDNQWNLSGGKL